MIPLTYEENKSYKEQEACHICKEKILWIKMMKIIEIKERLKTTVIIQENVEELLIVNVT